MTAVMTLTGALSDRSAGMHQLVRRPPAGREAPSTYGAGGAGQTMGAGACLTTSADPLVQRKHWRSNE